MYPEKSIVRVREIAAKGRKLKINELLINVVNSIALSQIQTPTYRQTNTIKKKRMTKNGKKEK